MSRDGANRLRRRDKGRAFSRAWDAALIHACEGRNGMMHESGCWAKAAPDWGNGEDDSDSPDTDIPRFH